MANADWTASFPGLQKLEPAVAKPLIETSKVVRLPAGTRIFGPGQAPEAYLLLLEGTVRVQQVSDAGREIVLYRVSAGERCALTTKSSATEESIRSPLARPKRSRRSGPKIIVTIK